MKHKNFWFMMRVDTSLYSRNSQKMLVLIIIDEFQELLICCKRVLQVSKISNHLIIEDG